MSESRASPSHVVDIDDGRGLMGAAKCTHGSHGSKTTTRYPSDSFVTLTLVWAAVVVLTVGRDWCPTTRWSVIAFSSIWTIRIVLIDVLEWRDPFRLLADFRILAIMMCMVWISDIVYLAHLRGTNWFLLEDAFSDQAFRVARNLVWDIEISGWCLASLVVHMMTWAQTLGIVAGLASMGLLEYVLSDDGSISLVFGMSPILMHIVVLSGPLILPHAPRVLRSSLSARVLTVIVGLIGLSVWAVVHDDPPSAFTSLGSTDNECMPIRLFGLGGIVSWIPSYTITVAYVHFVVHVQKDWLLVTQAAESPAPRRSMTAHVLAVCGGAIVCVAAFHGLILGVFAFVVASMRDGPIVQEDMRQQDAKRN